MERIEFDPKNIKIVPITEVRPNTWNPKDKDTEEYAIVKQGIETNGLEAPIYVRTVADQLGYEIVDGEQRWRSCTELEYKNIVVYDMGFISDQRAKEWTLWFEHKVPMNQLSLAYLLRDMRGLPDLNVPFTKEQLDNYTQMADFDWEQFTKSDILLEFPETEKEHTFKVPLEKLKQIKEMIGEEDQDGVTLHLQGVHRIRMILAQKKVFDLAVEKVKKEVGDMPDGKAVEMLCADYLGKS